MGLTVDKITTFLTYWLSVVLAYFGTQTPERLALYFGGSCAIFTALVNFWYQRKKYRYLVSMGIDKGVIRGLIR
ncbi:phage holin family protein [Citrobacter sp. Ct235]|uniref:primosomal protein n=1 Tax=Citrobacter sp. Ct235 TaxID=2985157 RepID=UPI00257877B0|nr:primosomal protein [Citrobacter sp. Ct235]MDM2736144.1 phage holin family protein [Citrobacter sp. Ct235]